MKIILKGKDAEEYIEYLKKKGDVTSTPETDDVQNTKEPIATYNANRKELLSNTSIAPNATDVNIPPDDKRKFKGTLEDCLSSFGVSFSEDPTGGSPSANRIGCKVLVKKEFDRCGYEKTYFVFSVVTPIWIGKEYGGQHFHKVILEDIFAFTDAYYDVSELSAEQLRDHLTGTVRGNSKSVSPHDFIREIEEAKNCGFNSGTATLIRYNMGMGDQNKLPDILN